MSARERQPTELSEPRTDDQDDEASTKISPSLIQERIKINLELLNAQTITPTQFFKKN